MKLITRAEQIGLTWPGHNKEGQINTATTQNTTEPQLLRKH